MRPRTINLSLVNDFYLRERGSLGREKGTAGPASLADIFPI